MKKNDPRLVKIADWRNHATENEDIWISYIWAWYDRNFLQKLRSLDAEKINFLYLCQTDEIFTTVTSGPKELSEDEKRERQKEQLQGWIDPSTGKPYVEPPEPVGPFLDENGVFRNEPRLSGKARKKIIEILPAVVELWEEGLLHKRKKIPDKWKELSFDKWLELASTRSSSKGLDAFLDHPRLKRCRECKKWFVVSKTDQKFCQTPASDRPVNRRTGKPRPLCRIVAYQRTEEYKEKTAAKMAKWRQKKEQVANLPPAEPVQKPRRHRRSKSSK